jgi:hypothetical protein
VDGLDRKTTLQQNAIPTQLQTDERCEADTESLETIASVEDGERGRNRTYNLLIKSQLLCQLSYAPVCGFASGEFRFTSCGLLAIHAAAGMLLSGFTVSGECEYR